MGTKINSIDLPNSISIIGSGAFANCNNLKHIKLPKNIEYITKDIFIDSINIELIEVPEKLDTSNLKEYFKENEINCKIKVYKELIKNK